MTPRGLRGTAGAPPAIKFCGLTRPEDVARADSLGARFLGAIRAGGPRRLAPDVWRTVMGAARDGVDRVAVIGRVSVTELLRDIAYLGADVAQWHGDPSVDDVQRVVDEGIRLWPVVRVAGGRLPAEAWTLGRIGEALVLDAMVPGQLGGTGVTLNWAALAADVERWRGDLPTVPLVLAGGLTADNVSAAMALLAPDVVDVSSGVELAPGIKDPERMRAFVDAVRGRG